MEARYETKAQATKEFEMNDLDLSQEVSKEMIRIYVCGPMTGIPDFNRAAFRDAARTLRECGFEVVTPVDCYTGDSWEAGMKHDIPAMLSCDRVTLLEGWERSRGARLEVFIAREVGMEVETLTESIWNSPGVNKVASELTEQAFAKSEG